MKRRKGQWIGFGLILGIAIGAALENVGLGIALGLVIGAAVDRQQNSGE